MSGLTSEQLFAPLAKKPPPVPAFLIKDKDKDKDKDKIEKKDNLEDNEIKRQRHRQKCVQEIVDTEQTYSDQLNVLTELYVEPLKSNGILKPGQHSILFPDIQTISGLSNNLLITLKERLQSWDNFKSRIGDEFVKFAPYFKMYQNYVNNHEKATKMLELLGNSEKFQQFCTQQQTNPRSKGLPLASFLILPIQRIPRYELCFRELLKLTNSDHPDYNDIQSTLEQIETVNSTINTRMKDFSSREQVNQVEQRFGGGLSLVTPARHYVREGYLYKVCRKKDRKYLFILFSDLLLYCTQSATGRLSLNQKMPLDRHFRIENIEINHKYGQLCFKIHSTVKSFLVYADNLAEKNAWLEDLNKCLERMAAVFALARSSDADDRKTTAPIWFPDDFSEDCMNPACMKHFSWKRRRHHCRYCGKLVCRECSSNKLPYRNDEEKIGRVCDVCYHENKSKFPDLEERLKSKKWFPAGGRSIKMQDEDDDRSEDDFDDSDDSGTQDTPTGHSKKESISKLSPRLSGNFQDAADKLNSPEDKLASISKYINSLHDANNKNGYNMNSMSEKRVRAPPFPPARGKAIHKMTLPISVSSPIPQDSPSPLPNTNKESRPAIDKPGSPVLPLNLDPAVLKLLEDIDNKYKAKLDDMKEKLEIERQKVDELQKQVKELTTENATLRKSKNMPPPPPDRK